MPKTKTESEDLMELIGRVVAALDTQIVELQEKRAQLAALTGQPSAGAAVAVTAPQKRTMSAEAKAKISAAAKKRWAAKKNYANKSGLSLLRDSPNCH